MATISGTKTWWIWLITGTLLGIIIMLLFGKGCTVPKPQTRIIYKSDTTYIALDKWHYDTLKVPYEAVLPEKVYIYRDSPAIIENAPEGWVKKDTTPLNWGFPNSKFYGRFIGDPKLISGDFTNDSISLTLFDTSGNIVKRVWPVQYNILDYHYRDNRLLASNRKAEKSTTIKLPDGITTSANAYGFYSLLHGGFTVASDFWVTRKRFSIGAIGELRTYPTYGDIKVGVKYTIK